MFQKSTGKIIFILTYYRYYLFDENADRKRKNHCIDHTNIIFLCQCVRHERKKTCTYTIRNLQLSSMTYLQYVSIFYLKYIKYNGSGTKVLEIAFNFRVEINHHEIVPKLD